MITDNVPTTDSKLANLLANPAMLNKLRALLKKDFGLDIEEQKAKRLSIVRSTTTNLYKPYRNKVTVACSLCSTVTHHTLIMAWNLEQKCYTACYGILTDSLLANIPTHHLNLIADNCSSCSSILINWPKEHLIELLINRLKRDSIYLEKYHESMAEQTTSKKEVP